MQILKRDGITTQEFDINKVIAAIRAAWVEVHGVADDIAIDRAAREVVFTMDHFEREGSHKVPVERVQDIVETMLMHVGAFDVAKAYILFRQRRADERAADRDPDPNAISQYILASKYARHRPDLQRRELHSESVDRVEEMHVRRYPEHASAIREAFGFVRRKAVLASMRSMQFGGLAMEAVNERGFNCCFTLLDRRRAFAETMYLLLCGCGTGYSVQFRHVEKLPEVAYQTGEIEHHVVEDTIEGWANALDALVNAMYAGRHVEFAYHLIRKKGSVLRTSGGRAPGHVPLRDALENIRRVFLGAQGRQLRPIECHEIQCFSADAVLSGGIRRSAMNALFSLDDGEMMNCKATNDWHEKKPHLGRANNSAVLLRSLVQEEQFFRVFKYTRKYGEPGFAFVNDYDHGYNPCQPAWATVLTPEGIRTIGDIDVGSTIWSGTQWTKVTKKWSTGTKRVRAYHTRTGVFIGTDKHRVVQAGQKIEVGDADAIDQCLGPVPPRIKHDPAHVIDGLVLGDGSYHHASRRVFLCAGSEEIQEYRAATWGVLVGAHRPGVANTMYEVDSSYISLPLTYEREIPLRYRNGDTACVAAFLHGLYTANGSVVDGRVTLKAASFKVITDVQQMLSSLGIPSYYTVNKAHDVEHHNGTYTSRESYDLNIGTALGRRLFAELIGFTQQHKRDKLEALLPRGGKTRLKTTYDIVDIEDLGDHEVFDITVEDDDHTYWTGGLLVSNCYEIGLDPVWVGEDGSRRTGWAFCNLTSINMAMVKDEGDWLDAAQAATIIGTLQASYTKFDYLGDVSERIARRDALIGVSMTGMQDCPIAFDEHLQEGVARSIRQWNSQWAYKLGIHSAARTTCVKPEGTGTLTLFCDETPTVGAGIHSHEERRYIRRVTANDTEPVFQAFRAVNPGMCEQKPDGNWVISFPIRVADHSTLLDDQEAIEFLEQVRLTQQNWVLPGTARESASPGLRHNVSCTVATREHEWGDVAKYLWDHRDDFTAVSFLPRDVTKIYAYAPYEGVRTPEQERRWRELVAMYKPVDYMNLREEEDGTNLTGDAACAGGACVL